MLRTISGTMYSESSSPRLSFSHDLDDSDILPLKQDEYCREDTLLLEPTSEFEFSSSSSHEHKSSSADELFFNGVILPLQIQEKNCAHKQTYYEKLPSLLSSLPPRPSSPCVDRAKKESFKEVTDANSLDDQKSQFKSFWGFKRSKSLDCDSKRGMLCSFPLLSRSKSTGSAPNPKKAVSTDIQKQKSYKQLVMVTKSTPSPPSSSLPSASSLYSSGQQKPYLNKSYGGSYGNGVRVSPVLNVPPPYISKGTANLLGLGSILKCGKDKRS